MQTTNENLPKEGFDVRLIESPEEKEQVFKLRYEVFVEEIGYTPHHANHNKKIVKEPLDDSAKIFAGFHNGQVVATARTNFCKDSELGFYPQIYKMQELAGNAHPQYTSISNYFLVKKQFRGTSVMLEIIESLFQELVIRKIKFDFADCEPYMIPLYTKLGYKNMGEMYHPEFGKGYLIMLDVLHNQLSNIPEYFI